MKIKDTDMYKRLKEETFKVYPINRNILIAVFVILIVYFFILLIFLLFAVPVLIQDITVLDNFLFLLGLILVVLGYIQYIFVFRNSLKEITDEMCLDRNSEQSLRFRKEFWRKTRVPFLYVIIGFIIVNIPFIIRYMHSI